MPPWRGQGRDPSAPGSRTVAEGVRVTPRDLGGDAKVLRGRGVLAWEWRRAEQSHGVSIPENAHQLSVIPAITPGPDQGERRLLAAEGGRIPPEDWIRFSPVDGPGQPFRETESGCRRPIFGRPPKERNGALETGVDEGAQVERQTTRMVASGVDAVEDLQLAATRVELDGSMVHCRWVESPVAVVLG